MIRRLGPVLLGLVLVSACAAPTSATAPAPAPGFPVSVDHAFGTTEVQAAPTRVVALSLGDADAALAAGVTPVAVVAPFYAPDGQAPWLAGRLGPDVQVIPGNPDFSIDVERVAAARPDLVLGTGAALTEPTYAALTGLGVPVLGHKVDPHSDTWQERTTMVGAAVGRPGEAAAAVEETAAAIAAVRERHPGLAGRTFSFSVIQSPTVFGTVVSEQDFLARLLGEFGMALTPELRGVAESAPGTGITVVSAEELTRLAADLVVVVPPSPELDAAFRADPRTAGLGHVQTMDMITATALRTPSVLSLRWGQGQLDASLGAVAA
jgi:iron complex transport system substrate-binding protein